MISFFPFFFFFFCREWVKGFRAGYSIPLQVIFFILYIYTCLKVRIIMQLSTKYRNRWIIIKIDGTFIREIILIILICMIHISKWLLQCWNCLPLNPSAFQSALQCCRYRVGRSWVFLQWFCEDEECSAGKIHYRINTNIFI